MALAGVRGGQCSTRDDHQEILAGVGDPSARAEIWADLEVQDISESVRTGAEKPGRVFSRSLVRLSCSTGHVCTKEQSGWYQTPPSCQLPVLRGGSSIPAQLMCPVHTCGLGSQALPALEVLRVLRTVGYKRTGLKPPPHFTQAVEQPPAGNDFPSLLTWTRLEPGNEMPHSPWPVLFPTPLLHVLHHKVPNSSHQELCKLGCTLCSNRRIW